VERQETRTNEVVFIIKISGPNLKFINDIISTLKNSYLVILESKPKLNDDNSGFHVFLTIVDARRQ
jgi:hypothetical protein